MKKLLLINLVSALCLSSTFSQSIIKITGTADILSVKHQVALSLNYLDIHEPVRMHIAFTEQMPEIIKGLTQYISLSDSTRLLRIRIDSRLDETQRLNVLAHEMMHVRQYLSGDLIIFDGKMVWRGSKYSFVHRDPRKLPWEVEAHRYDQYLAKVLRDIPGERLLASEIEK